MKRGDYYMAKIELAIAVVTFIVVILIGIGLYQFSSELGSVIAKIFKRK
jgi:hypothetical protein